MSVPSFRRQEIERLSIDGIQILPGRRALNLDVVDQLAGSIARIGLRHPITVRAIDENTIHLIAGRHRLEAGKKLGWEEIDCIVLEGDECSEVDAELWEIAENLHRADLTKKQRDVQIRRYADLIALRDAALQSSHSDAIESKRADKRGHRPEGVASKVAKETGVSVSTVRRALADPARSEGKPHKQAAPPVQRVKPSELDQKPDGPDGFWTPSSMWRYELLELISKIDAHVDRAPSPPDRAYGLKRLDGKWQALPAHHVETGEIIEPASSSEAGSQGWASCAPLAKGEAEQSSIEASPTNSTKPETAIPGVPQARVGRLTNETGNRDGDGCAERHLVIDRKLPGSDALIPVDDPGPLPDFLNRRLQASS